MKVCIEPHFIGREPVWEDHKEFYKHCVGPGWQSLLDDLTTKLAELGWDGKLGQVKEKFGTLRFYWRNNIPGIMGEIAEDVVCYAEVQTHYICEECGESGTVRGMGWLKCRCDECWKKEQECTCKGDFTCEAHRA